MSRKVGLGDTFFDPDVDGEVDFDFFGDEDGATTAGKEDAAGAGVDLDITRGQQEGKPAVESNNNINNNNSSGVRNATENQEKDEEEVRIKMAAKWNEGFDFEREKKMDATDVGLIIVDQGTKKTEEIRGIEQLDNDNFTLNTHHLVTYTNSLQTTATTTTTTTTTKKEEDDDEPVFSECDDSASDLFSDEDSSEESEDEEVEDYLDSDITEVSPLSSANMSPLPESPRRTPDPKLKRQQLLKNHSLSASPKRSESRNGSGGRSSVPPFPAAAINGSGGGNNYRKNHGRSSGASSCSGSAGGNGHDTVDLRLLAKAIAEMDDERKRNGGSGRERHQGAQQQQHSAGLVRPRRNMTFTNDEVRRIDHENKRLLRRIIDSQRPRRTTAGGAAHHNHGGFGGGLGGNRVASSAINRVKELRKIETENMVLLKRLQAAKPTKELSREFLLGSSSLKGATPTISESKSSFSLSAATTPARGRTGRCHSTGSLNSYGGAIVAAAGSGVATPCSASSDVSSSSCKGRPVKPTTAAKGIVNGN